MKKKYLLLIGILAVCCMLGGCKKKKDADKASDPGEPTIITKEDSVSGQVVEMQQGSQIDKSKITNIMGTQTATTSDLVVTNMTGDEISAFYVKSSESGDWEWGDDLIGGRFTLKDSDRALYYYEKGTDASARYDLMVSFAGADESDDCYFRELPLSDIQELSLNIQDGVPYVRYQSLSTKQQVSTLSAARKRMGLSDVSGNETDTSSTGTSTGNDRRSGTGTNAGNRTGTGTDTGTDTGTTDPTSAVTQPTDDGQGQTPSDTEPTQSADPGYSDPTPPGMDGQGEDPRDTAQGYVGQDMDSLVGEVGAANATEYGTDESTGNTIVYHYYDGFTVSTEEGDDGSQTVTGIW